jgi:hypothetical protein
MKSHTDSQAGGNPPQHQSDYQSLPAEHEKRRNRTEMKQPHKDGGIPINTFQPLPYRLFIHLRSRISVGILISKMHWGGHSAALNMLVKFPPVSATTHIYEITGFAPE